MSKTTRTRNRTLPLGTYAEATCRAEDRIDGLLPELEALHLSRADRAAVRKLAAEYGQLPTGESPSALDDDQAEQANEILDTLCSMAESYLLPYTYLGTHEHDGACFGVWASVESALEDGRNGELWTEAPREGYRKAGTVLSDVPRGELYLTVSDHGNVSLYQSLGAGKSREIWGVV